jgi:membrane dipeptidase
MVTRRQWLVGALSLGAAAGVVSWLDERPGLPVLSPEALRRARVLLHRYPFVDMHAHPGRTFLQSAEDLSWSLGFYRWFGRVSERQTVGDMRAGGASAAVFAGVADVQVLALGGGGLETYRDFAPGEAWASCQLQMRDLLARAEELELVVARTPEDVLAAHAQGRTACILGMEGADGLEGELDRLDRLWSDGLRVLTLVHYRHNEVQAADADGLTRFGASLVDRMVDLGMLIDLAHASERVVGQVLDRSRVPVLVSHSFVQTDTYKHPRFLSQDLARRIAARGGVVGVWPAGLGVANLEGYIDRIAFLVDLLGEAHVGLGTDMDANYQPVFTSYRQLPWVVDGLLKRGLSEAAVAAVLGGNMLRVWGAALAAAGNA